MASIKTELPEELMQKLSRLGSKTDEICEKALKEGGNVMKKAVSESLKNAIGNTKYKSKSTGELQRSLGITPVLQDKEGILNIKVGFDEPRSDGKSNAMIANILEYGRVGQKPQGFLKKAKNKSKKEVIAKMSEVIDKEIKKL